MDPLMLVAEWWWIAPVAAGGVTAGVIGVRHRSRSSGRRLAVDAARHDLKIAQTAIVEKKAAVKVARADVAQVSAERAARRATPEQVASAKRMLRDAERDVKAAAADIRARQARLQAARAAIPAASAPRPLDRLRSEHDAIVVQWMQYETDPSRQIAYPAMTDVKQPTTAAYLRAAGRATDLRREAGDRPTPAEFAAYRDGVAQLARAFEIAEHAARVAAGERPAAPAWHDAAQDAISRSAEAIDRAAEAAATAFTAWTARGRKPPRPPRDDT
ncbi:hypothetical protein KZC51_07700 [Microbacterium sp. SSW1-49]|uniref:Uncharacterized protein n=1 Tax=Microbacterium croceum TaxID=2851645 RepID=A0ABT0FDM0_9MICO|nr:hypothetical protein [Microbacterium croceum]MCK2036019.1 hypothetical protein [Microbacterium croceum]